MIVRRFGLLVVVLSTAIGLSCAVKTAHDDEKAVEEKAVADEISLKADRTALDEARKDIPEEVRKQNDEIALLMSYIVRESEEEPNRLRDRFNTALRKHRDGLDKKLRNEREDYTKKERKKRDEFLKKKKDERESYMAKKRDADTRRRYFEEQEDARREYFNDERDRRREFESRVQEDRRALEDFVREKQNAFNQEWRAYQTRYNERKKQLDVKKKMEEKGRALERPTSGMPKPAANRGANAAAATSSDPLAEFDNIPAGPGVPLEPQTPSGP